MSFESAGPASADDPATTYTGTASVPARTPGSGTLHLSVSRPNARFSSLSATYPLKLLAPTPLPSQPPNLATCYTLAYGGGLVAGDVISLSVQVDEAFGLVMLTQGSTKVFKHRPGLRPLSHQIIRRRELQPNSYFEGETASLGICEDDRTTRQRLLVKLETGALLLLLPDSVSPFRGSRYSQVQRFVLPADRSASVLVLDWVNSGRGYRPPMLHGPANAADQDEEIWAMDSYASTNQVLIGDKMIMRERMVLDNESDSSGQPKTAAAKLSRVATRLAPYHVYGTLLLVGPRVAPLAARLTDMCDKTSQFQLASPPGLIWAYSKTDEQGGILRFAAHEVEDARMWLRQVLRAGKVDELVGPGLWPRCI